MSALNADEPKTDNAGLPEAQVGRVTIEATAKDDVHLGDERVIYGHSTANGMHGDIDPDTNEVFAAPNRAKVTKEVADALVKAKQAKRV